MLLLTFLIKIYERKIVYINAHFKSNYHKNINIVANISKVMDTFLLFVIIRIE